MGNAHPWYRGSVAVAVVALSAGLLFAANASVFAGEDDTRPDNLSDLVAQENEALAGSLSEVEGLRAELAELQASLEHDVAPASPALSLAVGLEDVVGPGLSVTLDDAPAGTEAEAPDDLLVHQQDLEAVVNALWAGGAEAMTIQGQRVVATTAVRCIGNVLLLHGRTYSPPYVIEAIGDPVSLLASIEQDRAVQVYLEYVAVYGLGWSVSKSEELGFPAYSGDRRLTWANAAEATP